MKFQENVSHRTKQRSHTRKLHHIENYSYVPVVTLKFSEKVLVFTGL